MKPFISKHMFGASCKSSSPLKQKTNPKASKPDATASENTAPMTKSKYESNRRLQAEPNRLDKTLGTETNPKTGVSKAKAYEKTYVKNDKGYDYVKNSKGGIVSKARTGSGDADKQRSKFVSDSTGTVRRRTMNADYVENSIKGRNTNSSYQEKMKKYVASKKA